MIRFRILLAVALAGTALSPVAALAADQVVANCSNDSELRADLTAMQSSGGGTLTFSCAMSTIVLTADLPTITQTTIIDGGGKVTISGGNARRIFSVDAGANLWLQGLVLANAYSAGDGGAIANNGQLVLKQVTIRDSQSAAGGGALVTYGPVQIEDSEFDSNTALAGGAVYARFAGAPVTILRTSIHDNDATDEDVGYGGGVLLWDGASLTIEDSSLSKNHAQSAGGGIHNMFGNSSVVVRRCQIAENSTSTKGGAGIFILAGPLLLVDSWIYHNTAPDDGPGLSYQSGSSALISRTTLQSNVTDGGGGAVKLDGSTGVSFVNVTMWGNAAKFASALYVVESSVSLVNVTIASNSVSQITGAITQYSANTSRTTTLRNVLMGDNDDPNLHELAGSIVSADGNVSSDNSGAGILNKAHDHSSAEILIGDPGFHGGLTPTVIPQPGSAAIDAGVATDVPATDQRGFARIVGVSPDAGAVEVAACTPGEGVCGDANESGKVTSSDALLALRTAVHSETCALWLCDFDGSGKVTATDALLILRISVGQPISGGCPLKWDCHA